MQWWAYSVLVPFSVLLLYSVYMCRAILSKLFFSRLVIHMKYASDMTDCMPWFLRLILYSFAYQSGYTVSLVPSVNWKLLL